MKNNNNKQHNISFFCRNRIMITGLIVSLTAGLISVNCYAADMESDDFKGIFQAFVSKIEENEDIFYEYPVLNGIDGFDQKIVDEINQYFYDTAQKSIAAQAAEIQSMKEEIMEYNPEAVNHMCSEVTCDNIFIEEEIFSVMQSGYSYTGGAHGYGYSFGTSFNLCTGKEMTMGELLGCDEMTAQEAVVESYREHVIDQVENITESDIRNSFDMMEYWMEADGLHVDIAAYGIASYAAGPQHAVVTQEILDRVISNMGYSQIIGSEAAISGGGSELNVGSEDSMISVINGIQAPASDFVIPHSSVTALTDADLVVLEGASVEEEHYKSQLAINEILARYGYQFHPEQGGAAKEAYDQFEGKSWYEQAKQYCPSASASEMLYNYISSLELANIDLICEWQQAHGCYY